MRLIAIVGEHRVLDDVGIAVFFLEILLRISIGVRHNRTSPGARTRKASVPTTIGIRGDVYVL